MFLRFVKLWLPALLWMAVIFSASTDAMSANRTSRFIGPFLRWFNPEITDQTVKAVQFGIRKTGHVTEYAILALLLWRALRKRKPSLDGRWNPTHARLAVALSGLYAISDEIHQSFVPSRQGSPWDVLLDTAGATIAILMLWRYGRWKKLW